MYTIWIALLSKILSRSNFKDSWELISRWSSKFLEYWLKAEALKTNTRLKKINLCGNPIGDNGRFALGAAVKGKSIKLSFVKNFIVIGEKDFIYHILEWLSPFLSSFI